MEYDTIVSKTFPTPNSTHHSMQTTRHSTAPSTPSRDTIEVAHRFLERPRVWPDVLFPLRLGLCWSFRTWPVLRGGTACPFSFLLPSVFHTVTKIPSDSCHSAVSKGADSENATEMGWHWGAWLILSCPITARKICAFVCGTESKFSYKLALALQGVRS